MSNNLPPGTVPKIRRIKIKGKEIGNFYIMLRGEKVNLKTTDYMTARDRAKEAVEVGTKEWPDANQRALPPVGGEFRQESQNTPSDWTADVAAAASGAYVPPTAPEPAQPDAVYPPALPPVVDKEGATDKPPPTSDGETFPEFTQIPPEFFEQVIDQAAQILVELQLTGHAFLIRKMLKREAGEIPENHAARKGTIMIWKAWLSKSIDPKIPLPEYVVAPLMLLAFAGPEQLMTSKPIPKEEKGPVSPAYPAT